MITHIIEEAVFLADRIVVMGTKPGHIRQIITNTIPHPRDYQSTAVPGSGAATPRRHRLRASSRASRRGSRRTGVPVIEPVPSINLGEVFGLMEILRDNGGAMDVFRLDGLTDYDFGHTLSVVKAGEMFDFLDTPKNRVVLTGIGTKFLDADINTRKTILNQQLQKLGLFRFVVQILKEAKNNSLPMEIVQEEIVMRLPTEDVEALTKSLIAWGRFAELLGYSPEEERVYLDKPVPVEATC